jgi:hypothetical protein
MRRPLVVLVPVALALAAGLTGARLFADDSAPAAPAPAAPAPAAPSKAKEEKVRKLLRLQGMEALAKLTFDKMLDQFKSLPGLPSGFLEKFREMASVEEIVDLSVPSYVNHLDDSTLDALIVFYESPEGRKFSAQMPVIQTESIDAGAAWGQKKALEVMSELQGEKPK